MTMAIKDNIAKCAVRGLTSKTGNPVDSVFAFTLVDNFLNIYRTINSEAYHGNVYSFDVRRVLEMYFCKGGGDKFYMMTEKSVYDFFQLYREPYNTATFADYASYLISKTITDAFGI